MGALSGSREPSPSCTGLGPSGFDPERVTLCTSRQLIRRVAERWKQQYAHYKPQSPTPWKPTVTIAQFGDALEALNVETATVAEVNALMATNGWVTEECDLCDNVVEKWLQVGQEPEYEARWLNICLPCAEHFTAIAMEARQGGDVQQAPSRSDDSAAIAQTPSRNG